MKTGKSGAVPAITQTITRVGEQLAAALPRAAVDIGEPHNEMVIRQ